MSALVEFLLARITDDEAAAREAGGDQWRVRDVEWRRESYAGLDVDRLDGRPLIASAGTFADAAYGLHIARHDPARVLAESAAKREIVRLVGQLGGHYEPDAGRMAPRILHHLAAVYSDHPDYRAEWADTPPV